MIRKKLLKKAAIATIAAAMSLTTMGTTAFAAEKEEANNDEIAKEETNEKETKKEEVNTEEVEKEEVSTEETNTEEVNDEKVEKEEAKNSEDEDTTQTSAKEDEEVYNYDFNEISENELDDVKEQKPIWIKEGTYTVKISDFFLDGGPYVFDNDGEYYFDDYDYDDPSKVREDIKKAFDNFTIDFHDKTITVTFDVSNFSIFNREAIIEEIRASVGDKNNYDPTVDLGGPKTVYCDIVDRDKDGNPTKFSYKYNVDDEFFTGRVCFDFKFKDPKYEGIVGFVEGGFGIDSVKEYEGDNKVKATNTVDTTSSDEKSSEELKDETVKAQPMSNTEIKSSKTPKTADASAMNVIYSSILGGFSLMSMGGIYVYRRKRDM